MYKKINKIHMVGMGGIGMSGIAELLFRNGYQVSGSDLASNDNLRKLSSLGLRVFVGHSPHHVQDAELVVYSSAVKDDNPEIAAAKNKAIPVISRVEMLAELMRLKWGIAVAGAHGKTTTTSMIGHVLTQAGLDPTIVVGGRMDNFGGTNARLGNGEFMVVEADESDGSFNHLTPSIAVVTNMDREHMDYFKTMFRLKLKFTQFLNHVPFYGLSIFCGDDPMLNLIRHRLTRRTKSFGFDKSNDYRATNYLADEKGRSHCDVLADGKLLKLCLQVPGRHNVLNALATLAVADELSVNRQMTLESLACYQGVQRRFQKRGEIGGVLFIDDYAHHPREIEATLTAARDFYPRAKIRAVFQPHRYSRFEDLFAEFSRCFSHCDALAVVPIYGAGEKPIPGISSELLVESLLRDKRCAVFVETPAAGIRKWLSESSPGDIILTLGAGDLPQVYRDLF